jgi:hypothetical protein
LNPQINRARYEHLHCYMFPEIEPDYIPELTYVEDPDYDNSGSQIPVFDTFWS